MLCIFRLTQSLSVWLVEAHMQQKKKKNAILFNKRAHCKFKWSPLKCWITILHWIATTAIKSIQQNNNNKFHRQNWSLIALNKVCFTFLPIKQPSIRPKNSNYYTCLLAVCSTIFLLCRQMLIDWLYTSMEYVMYAAAATFLCI